MMLGIDTNAESLASAQANIERNGLAKEIALFHTLRPDGALAILEPLFHPDTGDLELSPFGDSRPTALSLPRRLDFTICNPPFYTGQAQLDASAGLRRASGAGAWTTTRPPGAAHELSTTGGEAAFVRRLVDESCLPGLQTRIRWYTSQLGFASHVEDVRRHLREKSIANFQVAEFRQGRTARWAIAWSHTEAHIPRSPLAIGKHARPRAIHFEEFSLTRHKDPPGPVPELSSLKASLARFFGLSAGGGVVIEACRLTGVPDIDAPDGDSSHAPVDGPRRSPQLIMRLRMLFNPWNRKARRLHGAKRPASEALADSAQPPADGGPTPEAGDAPAHDPPDFMNQTYLFRCEILCTPAARPSESGAGHEEGQEAVHVRCVWLDGPSANARLQFGQLVTRLREHLSSTYHML
ncbi:hypothetical protein, variant [Fonticula alba]|nr:hypothetical protein, variant [Fonticula alba]KCV70430.1 hypothetical protein, variant [Fonticula alba]|eukprot:XP_009494946.1 hypothetical protein, variant [Fonticula alba]